MGTKRTKKEEPAVPAAKAAPKRKVAVRPGAVSSRKPAPAEVEKPAPPAKATKKPATVAKSKAVKASKSAPEPVAAAIPKPARVEISTEAIALRAYFLGEARQNAGLAGDSTTDWLEAERQLRAEL